MDSKDRFSAAADDYAKYRPDYPDDVVHACADYASLKRGAHVVDIGCGTGISSRLFARNGYRVTGVEPNEPMLAKARQSAGGPEYVQGDAARTGLLDASADLITCAQALHWLDMDSCAPEWRRILKRPSTGPGQNAACAAFWNYRRDDGWQSEYEALLCHWSSEYGDIQKATGKGEDNSDWVKNSPLCIELREHNFANSQHMDWQALLGRANSSSYVIHGVQDRAGFEKALKRLFERHSVNGFVEFSYRTYVLLWRFARDPG
jgi:SAM-dependent methyltransferase